MAMSETDGRVSAHHVDIATTIFVPDMSTLAAHKSHGQRLVIRRSVTGFEATQFAHCSLTAKNVSDHRLPVDLMPARSWSSSAWSLSLGANCLAICDGKTSDS